jgi:hypothetical protein
MKNLILFGFLLLSFYSCLAQETVTARYIGDTIKLTKNNSFICKEIRFVSDNDNDTLFINVRLPLKITTNRKKVIKAVKFIDMGIYYNCHLQQDTIYTIMLQRICVTEIPDICNSYYFTNAVFDSVDCSKFTEIEKNTPYEYKCSYSKDYGKFVDINGILYEIVGLKPDNDCFYPH